MILLEVRVWHWQLRALDRIFLPHAGNTLRGALGYALAGSEAYGPCFRPEAAPGTGPSGLADLPRPFVLRADHLDGAVLQPGSMFGFDMHSFEAAEDRFHVMQAALSRAGASGLGPTRGRAQLLPAAPTELVRILLTPPAEPLRRARVLFLTPTELKGGALNDFGALLARARDRVAALRTLYGSGPLDVDFRGLGDRARAVRTVSTRLGARGGRRRSSRTGQTHSLGGQTGEVVFEGDLNEFWPWLEAAQWTGVGRQTVWGKGAIRIEPLPARETTSEEEKQPFPS